MLMCYPPRKIGGVLGKVSGQAVELGNDVPNLHGGLQGGAC